MKTLVIDENPDAVIKEFSLTNKYNGNGIIQWGFEAGYLTLDVLHKSLRKVECILKYLEIEYHFYGKNGKERPDNSKE